jgi:hypothetical protein
MFKFQLPSRPPVRYRVLLLSGILLFTSLASVHAAESLRSGEIALSTCDHDAGAICSLTWRGKQFIDDYDHGRQLQSAVSFDGRGESENPTEAGASYLTDRYSPHASSSVLLASDVTGGVLSTLSRPAYWLPLNGVATSNLLFAKRVQFGFSGAGRTAPVLTNVLQYEVSYTIPANETHKSATFESLTAYVPREFSQIWTYDLKHGATNVAPLSDGPGEQDLPVILSTPDQRYAIGVYSPGISGGGYGRWRFPDVMKWNVVNRVSNPKGTYRFKSYVVVGTLASVMADLNVLLVELDGSKRLARRIY